MKVDIDWNFTAKDSDLKYWEYKIPNGMEAEIKDGKIIVRAKDENYWEKKYKEALENARCYYIAPNQDPGIITRLEDLFPELSES